MEPSNIGYFIAGIVFCFLALASIGLSEELKSFTKHKFGKITDFTFNWTSDADWKEDLTGIELTRIIVRLLNKESWRWMSVRVSPGKYRMRTKLYIDFVEVENDPERP